MSSKTKTNAVQEDGKPALVPKLRFPEFRGAGAWKSKRLGDLFSDRQESGQTGLPLLSLMDKEGIVPQEDSNRKNNSNSDKSKYLRVVPGDIAYNTMRMWEGRSALVGLEGLVSPAYTVCEPQPGVHSLLFSYYFKTPQLIEQFRRYSQGLVKDTLNLKYAAFSQVSAPIPTFPEQQKIASCLSSVDELIAAQARKLASLKTHKKGLMQQLFPGAGETQPRLRFPEFQNAPKWISNSLGSIFDTSSGGTPDRTKEEYWNGSIPWITTSLVGFNIIIDADEFITDAGLNNSSAKVFPENTILMAMYGQGKTRGQVAMLGIKAATNQACAAILPRKDIDPRFVFLNLGSRYEELRGLSNSGGQENLSQGLIQGIQFSYPNDKAEQQRIADCLTSLDALIAAQTHKLAALKTHKQGLMQQLFPAPEEPNS